MCAPMTATTAPLEIGQKGLSMAKRYSDATLMAMTKAELIEQLRCAEHNEDAANERLNQQAKNFRSMEPVRHGLMRKSIVDVEWYGRYYICMGCGCNMMVTADDGTEKEPKLCPLCGKMLGLEVPV